MSEFNGEISVVNRAAVNFKESGGYTVGGGLRISNQGSFEPKFIFTVKAITRDKGTAVRYRKMLIAQQAPPHRGQVVFTDQNTPVNDDETLWGTRAIVPSTTTTVDGIAISEIAARVFLQILDTGEDITKPTGKGSWELNFIATEI